MHSDNVSRGFPSRSPGIKFRASTSFDDLAEEVDASLARSVDAVIDDLPPRLRMALSARFLGCRWFGDRDELPEAVQAAKAAVAAALVRRGVL